jgi:uncharacterized protein YabE (DUF348 family)
MLLALSTSRMTSLEVILAALQARALRTDDEEDVREAWENNFAEGDKIDHNSQQQVELNADGIEALLDAGNHVRGEDEVKIEEDQGANPQEEIVEEH